MEQIVDKKITFKDKIKKFLYETFTYPFFLISHPIQGWEDFKKEKKGKLWVAIFYLVMMIFTVILKEVGTGFLVNQKGNKDFNLFITISLVILPVVIGTVGNWCVTALFDGKGKMLDIFKAICYSFFPFVWLGIIATILSNFIVLDEVAYVTFLLTLATIITVYMMFFALRGIHEYGVLQNILTIIFTIVAIAIILFVILLFLSFIQQIFNWILSIINELRKRYF